MTPSHQLRRDPSKTIEVLYRISQAVSTTRNLGELYREIHQSLGDILNVDNFYIALYDPESDCVTFPFHKDEKAGMPDRITAFSKKECSTAWVIQNQKPAIFTGDDIILIDPAQPGGNGVKTWLGAPLMVRGRVKGAMVIQSYHSGPVYEKEDLELLNSASQFIALAIERKESEETLFEQRRVLQNILETSPVGIALVENRVFKWVNTEMIRLFGCTSKLELENKSVRLIYRDQADYNRTGTIIYRGLDTTGTADYEIDLIKKDGSVFPAHIRINSGDVKDPMSWTIAIISDISQRKTAEAEKYERERLQGVLEMAGAVCHEINQPLQSILGYAELLGLDNTENREMEKANITYIKEQAARLGRITKKLSSITHYRTVDYPGNTKIVDIWNASSEIKTQSDG